VEGSKKCYKRLRKFYALENFHPLLSKIFVLELNIRQLEKIEDSQETITAFEILSKHSDVQESTIMKNLEKNFSRKNT